MHFIRKPPRHVAFPLITMLTVNLLTYYGTRSLTQSLPHHDLSMALDDMIPFVPFFIVFYVAAYLQWVVGFLAIAADDRETGRETIAGEIVAKLICAALFILLPTAVTRPEFAPQGIWEQAAALLYRIDSADNLFPSIHCLESWMCFRGAQRMRHYSRWYTGGMLVLTLLVFASVVLVKQHVAVDIVGGVAVAEAGLYLSSRHRLGRVFDTAFWRRRPHDT